MKTVKVEQKKSKSLIKSSKVERRLNEKKVKKYV
jgi:hypothetical protein